MHTYMYWHLSLLAVQLSFSWPGDLSIHIHRTKANYKLYILLYMYIGVIFGVAICSCVWREILRRGTRANCTSNKCTELFPSSPSLLLSWSAFELIAPWSCHMDIIAVLFNIASGKWNSVLYIIALALFDLFCFPKAGLLFTPNESRTQYILTDLFFCLIWITQQLLHWIDLK